MSSRAVRTISWSVSHSSGRQPEMLRLVGARCLEERFETGAVGQQRPPRLAIVIVGLEDLVHQRVDQRLFGGEPSVERAHADTGDPGDVGHAGVEALGIEDLGWPRRATVAVVLPRRGAAGGPVRWSHGVTSLRLVAGECPAGDQAQFGVEHRSSADPAPSGGPAGGRPASAAASAEADDGQQGEPMGVAGLGREPPGVRAAT